MGEGSGSCSRGYSTIELVTVLAIAAIVVLITIPSFTSWYEMYLLRTNVDGVAAYLKLARMKAVASNVSYVIELDPAAAVRSQCGASWADHHVAVYRDTTATPKVDECFAVSRRIGIESVSSPVANQMTFRANGMAMRGAGVGRETAPNWFLVRSRNGRRCQLVCINTAGAVRKNPVTEECTSAPYGASASTPCPPPT